MNAVQDIDVPPLVPPTTTGSLADLPRRWRDAEPGRPLFAVKDPGDAWRDVSAAEFSRQVDALAKGLVAAGVGVGDSIGIMSRTRYEWTLADFAIWTAGAVPVPVYETSSAEQVRWIGSDSDMVAIFVETGEHAALLAEVRDDLAGLRDVWQLDAGAVEELSALGASVSDEDLLARVADLDRASLATIIYTSGTTGNPKGCELTHDNFMALTANAAERLSEVVRSPGASTLLFLPLAHVFARFIEVLAIDSGVRLAHTPDVTQVLPDLGSFHPSFVLAVPRVFEKIYNSSEQKAEAGGKGKIFRAAAATAGEWSRAQDTGGAGLLLRAKHALFDKLVYGKIREAMGGNVTYAVSGGAALGERLGHFFRGIGVTILEGYGLTETTAPATVNTPELIKIGTVGPPLPGVALRVDEDGEVLVKGNNVFRAYRNNPEATAEALEDGWFRTGDLGELDEQGYLRITGRKKEILVTANGKNVSPAVLEDRLRAHPLVSQCIVVGDGQPYVAALITLDSEMYPAWAGNNGLDGVSLEDARTHPTVIAAIQDQVDIANKAVSRAESIRRFSIISGDFTVENGYLTPSIKLKRGLVMKDFGSDVDSLYSESGQRASS